MSLMNAGDALSATLDAIADGVIRLAEDEALVHAALNLALVLRRNVSDCLNLARAEREGAVLASADRKLLALARSRGVDVIAIPSA